MQTGSQDDFELDTTAEYHWLAALRPRLAQIDAIKDHRRLQAALQREADAVKEALSVLRTRYNATSPIGRFPPEILCRIFSFSAVDEPPSPKLKNWPDISIVLGWIRLTHVCRYWREAALQEPTLWANVTNGLGLQWSKLMLARSKTVPISMSIFGGEGLDEDFSHNFSHLSHLDIQVSSSSLSREAAYWDVPAPLLESLFLSAFSDLISLPAHPFGDHAPLLRRVRLYNVYLPYNSPTFSNLIHLNLTWSPYYQHRGFSAFSDTARRSFQIEHLLGSLARMSALRTLTLEHCIPSPLQNLSPIRHSTPSVMLPYLETLKLVGTEAQCAEILDHLDFPQACRFHLSLACDNKWDEGPQNNLLPALRAHFFGKTPIASRQHAPVSILEVTLADQIRAWRCDVPTHEGNQCARPSIPAYSPAIEIAQYRRRACHSFQDICSIFPLDELRVFHKRTDWCSHVADPYEWLAVLSNCNALEDVLVQGSDILRFSVLFFNLAPVIESGTVRDPEDLQEAPRRDKVFFPNLRSLSLYEADFCSYHDTGHQFHHSLAKWLRIRQAFAPLPQLRIIDSSITRQQVDVLRKLVKVDISKSHLREDFESQ